MVETPYKKACHVLKALNIKLEYSPTILNSLSSQNVYANIHNSIVHNQKQRQLKCLINQIDKQMQHIYTPAIRPYKRIKY